MHSYQLNTVKPLSRRLKLLCMKNYWL